MEWETGRVNFELYSGRPIFLTVSTKKTGGTDIGSLPGARVTLTIFLFP